MLKKKKKNKLKQKKNNKQNICSWLVKYTHKTKLFKFNFGNAGILEEFKRERKMRDIYPNQRKSGK